MADRKKMVSQNVAGEFFVDTTCIDCDTCRQLAPSVFEDNGEFSFVSAQPKDDKSKREATRALLACPTGSIGCDGENWSKEVMNDFPLLLENEVFYCGFNSPKSYGGNSYFIKRDDGNWLVDSPKFNKHLVAEFEKAGGLSYIFLTHEDDVADADKYASHFSAQRIIHEAARRACPDAEIVVEGSDATQFAEQFQIIPTPGHTRGHIVLLYKNTYLFTGDHLAYDRHGGHLEAFDDYCWYSWEKQTESMKKLLDYEFEWILPGHGERVRFDKSKMKKELAVLVSQM